MVSRNLASITTGGMSETLPSEYSKLFAMRKTQLRQLRVSEPRDPQPLSGPSVKQHDERSTLSYDRESPTFLGISRTPELGGASRHIRDDGLTGCSSSLIACARKLER